MPPPFPFTNLKVTMETTPSYAPVVGADLPVFITQKQVHAAKIVGIEHDPHGDEAVLQFDGGQSLPVTTDWLQRRCGPASPVGGYFIAYADGYTSWSPAGPFEESATPATDYGLPLQQEPKYTVGPRGRLINRASGRPIPDNVPVMIFVGTDRDAIVAIGSYRQHAMAKPLPESIRQGATERLNAFAAFGVGFSHMVKDPD